jgi:hypothetical protein
LQERCSASAVACSFIIDFFFGFFAVFAAALKFAAVGAPASPGLRIFSPDPAAIRARFL